MSCIWDNKQVIYGLVCRAISIFQIDLYLTILGMKALLTILRFYVPLLL